MGGPNTPKLFSLFTLMVICFFVGNLYQISADSKIDGDLIFDSHDRHSRLQRNIYTEDDESSPPVEEHWLTSTVNRLKRSINSVFSKDAHNEKFGHHHVQKKSNHHRTKLNAFKKSGKKHKRAEYEDKEYDDGQSQSQLDFEPVSAQEGQSENAEQGQIAQDEDGYEGQSQIGQLDDLPIVNNNNGGDDDGFVPITIGEAKEDSNYDNTNDNDNGDDNNGDYNNGEVDTGPTDDEDNDEISGDREDYGSGDIEDHDYENVPSTTTYSVDQGHPRIYRVAFTIQEPYQNEYQDRNSQQFKTLAQRIKTSIENELQSIPGELFISVISLEKSQDPFKIRVTIDIDFEGNAGSDVIKRAIFEPISTNHRLGDLTTTDPEDLRFIEFGAEGPHCSEDELKCGSGQCIANSLRCNGVNDCNDGSDEEGCVHETPQTEPPVTEPTTQGRPYQPVEVFVTTTTTQAPVTEMVTTPPTTTMITTTTTTEKPSTTTTTTETDYIEPEPQTTTTTTTAATTTTIKVPDETEPPFTDGGSGAGECRADDSVRCSDGSRVICADQVCDGTQDCNNGADEDNCDSRECRQGEFKCDVYRCIPISQHCDGRADCTDGTDEHNCQRECNELEFACDDQCLSLDRRCDGIRDCADNTDETNCPEQQCQPPYFSCGRGDKCIPDYAVCDGRSDCKNNADESNCTSPGGPCAQGYIQCREGNCIEDYKRCNGYVDCEETSSDEENCAIDTTSPTITTTTLPSVRVCLPDEVLCGDGTCIYGKKCDRTIDCKDRFDEMGCTGFCDITEFQCGNGHCISDKLRCDGLKDCLDNSDEENCVNTCPNGQFRCENGICLDSKRRCDGYPDCLEGSDEEGCSGSQNKTSSCNSKQFDCGDHCISIGFRCDTFLDCLDGSDEEGCGNCRDSEFQCSDLSCIPKSLQCDGNSDCPDNGDETDCPEPPRPARCNSKQYQCNDGSCIDDFRQCDGTPDCPDSSDESDCSICPSNQFQCTNNFDCIPINLRCNGKNDCNDGSDEYNCPTERPTSPPDTTPRGINCPYGMQPCKSGDNCAKYCDGRVECYDMSDETDCSFNPQELDLRTYPNGTEERERQEVVLTCRDEGPLRAKVQWSRANGAPLPPGSTDINGRLTIPNIQLEHAGTYLCVAVGFPADISRTRVAVPLTVLRRPPRPTLPPSGCSSTLEATCSNGDCIPKSKIRDGRFDCTDGSDEDGYRPEGCEPNEFKCRNGKCIFKAWTCDSDDDCGDNTDEENCGTNPPGSVCQYHQFSCHSNNQCIPKTYHCDGQSDCVDGSDEVGCGIPVISRPPPPMENLNVGDIFKITCTAIGIPTPEIVWRRNWKHVPSKCTMTSNNGVGTLTCEDIQVEDQGAYTCEALNIKGAVLGVPDTILVVKQDNPCRQGYFNAQARSEGECISCFCFGHTSICRSADLFTFQFQPPFDALKYVGARVDPSGSVDIRDEPIYTAGEPQLSPYGPQGVLATVPEDSQLNQLNVIPYFAMPENYRGNQLKSYGGYLTYWIRHSNRGTPLQGPNVIITGNGYTLLHVSTHSPAPNSDERMRVRFFEGEWVERSPNSREKIATRQEIMMALENVENILIKLQYNEGNLNTTISNVEMDSAGLSNVGLGPANYVEECSCPVGYSGTSCEKCSPGYMRQSNGPWLGLCTKEPIKCPPGMYNDGRECQICPCPHTTPGNQFGRSCQLAPNGEVICNCPPEYVGNRCEKCAPGYQGNPLVSGDYCRPIPAPAPYCDAAGSLDPRPDQYGRCRCKNLVDGPTCNQCKTNSFHLSSSNQFGCVSCFCMGVSLQCASSNWYRSQVSTIFVSSRQNFALVDNFNRETPITEGIRLDSQDRQISYSGFRTSDVYYWSLPSRYQGNKLTSYGGYLRYSLRHKSIPGGQSSRNNAADVELVSKNKINLLYYNRNQTQQNPNGAQTFAVPILEQYWQRIDGQIADREHLLMVLADLEAIYIKATYFTNTQESSLISVALDTATDQNTGSNQRAVEVEQCHCPVGYTGLSCENCDVGYTRTPTGLYLGLCEACDCNGYSKECDPDTGVCLNCKDGTTGDYCDECLPGYTGDPSNGVPCRYRGTPPPCYCDPRGSLSPECRDGRCSCKVNVEGSNCDRCRSGSFGLNASSIDGCEFCFCSGISSECIESNLYREQIPYQITAGNHGFTITDQLLRHRITENFDINEYMNEISHGFLPSNGETMYWSLPTTFTGNQIKSYGGNLEYSQRYTHRPQAKYIPDKDVIIIGNGITIFWSHPIEQREGIVNPVSVKLHPTANWFRLDRNQGSRPASREDILTALAKIDAILIRATQSSDTGTAYLSDITLDTAVEQNTGNARASSVEVCRCPQGYEGTSCESCDAGYYKDRTFDESRPLGSCTKCPCNNNEESCELGPDYRVICQCKPEYTGRNCEFEVGFATTTEYPDVPTTTISNRVTIDVTIEDTNIGIYEIGSTVRYNCSARSLLSARPVRINWRKADGDLPSRAIDEGNGILVITDLRASDSGRYVCEASDGYTIVTSSVDLNVGVPREQRPRVAISQPYVDVNEGLPVEIQCVGTGVPTPDVSIVRADGQQLSPGQRFENGVFRIYQSRLSDSGDYNCIASNRVGTDYARFTVTVHEVQDRIVQVDISPSSFTGTAGDTVMLRCSGTLFEQTVKWSKQGGDLPYKSVEDRGMLIIRNALPEDSGVYICTVTATTGTRGFNRATVTITGSQEGRFPTAAVSVDRITLNQGASSEIQCNATGVPAPSVQWTRLGGELGRNAKQYGSTLRITNAEVEDRGVYVCVSTNVNGLAQATVVVEVIRLETPRLEIYPSVSQTVIAGNSAVLQCRAVAGIPTPEVFWSRENNLPLSSNVEEMAGGALRFTQITLSEQGEYICTANNEAGSATATAQIIVHIPPDVIVTPRQEVITRGIGDQLRLECEGTGLPLPAVSWIKQDAYSRLYSGSSPRLSNKAYQEFARLTKEDEGVYLCKAESSAGIASRRVQLIVDVLPSRGDITGRPPTGEDATSSGNGDWRDNEPARPHFTTTYRPPYPTHDQEFTVALGGRAELECRIGNAEGSSLDIRWSRTDGNPLPSRSIQRNGVLYIDNVEQEAQGEYRCSGYDSSGRAIFSVNPYLTVIFPPRITLVPQRQVVHPGEHAYINCSASGDQPIEISWSPMGRDMPNSVYTREGYIRFNNIQLQDAGRYLCTANNRAGKAEAVADVIVEENVSRPAIKAEQKQQQAPIGTNVSLRCRVTNPNFANTVRWFRAGPELPYGAQEDGELLYLRNVRQEDQGRYYCEIQTNNGTISDYVDLILTGPEPPTRPQESQYTITFNPPEAEHNVGEDFEVYCQSSERGAITMWSKISGPLSDNVISVNTVLRIANLSPQNQGVYRCEATGRLSTYYKDYNLFIIDDQIKDQPPLQTKEAERGSTVQLDCKANFDATEYVWTKQGGELPRDVNEFSKTIQLNDVDSSDAGVYTCTASNGDQSMEIPVILVVTGIVPYFTQAPNSYISIPTLSDSYMQFVFEISFKPQQDTGLILYNGEKGNDRGGDYIALSLVGGIPEFKFNLGAGTTLVRAERPITIGDWHTIKISRNRRKVTMYIDGDGPIVGVAEGKYTGLDLTEPMFLGGVPNVNGISREVLGYEQYHGFVGCISRLKIGHAHLDILREALNKTGITTCESCSESKCQNQGVCQEALSKEGYMCICSSGYSGPTCSKLKGEACSPHACGIGRCIDTNNSFECQCPLGRAGRRCQREITVIEPAFQNDAYIAYPTPKPARKFKLTLKVKPNTLEDGILLYCSESEEGYGNFISLAIKDRHLEFRFDAGNGATVIRDETDLKPGEWHVLTATRSLGEGRLIIDEQAPAIGRSTGNYKTINLQTPLYVGGYDKHHIKINDGVQVYSGFNGCIGGINLSGIDVNLIQNITDSANVRDCNAEEDIDNNISGSHTERPFRHVSCSNNPCQNNGQCYPLSPTTYQCACAAGFTGKNCQTAENVCEPNPCQNQGTCVLRNTHYECDCTLGFTGRNCDQVTEIRNDAHFDGNGYLEFSRDLLAHRDGEQEVIALELSTNQSNGLIFWHGQTPSSGLQGNNYIALATANGFLEYSFDLGDGPAIVTNNKRRIDDGNRHSVILKRDGKRGSIEIDNSWTQEGDAPGTSTSLNVEGNIYIGGTPNISRMTGNKFTQGFNGCIHGFELQNTQRLDLGIKAINGLNVRPCSSFSGRDIWLNDLVN